MADTRPPLHLVTTCPECGERLTIEARLSDQEIVRYLEWYEKEHPPAPAAPPDPKPAATP